VEFYSLFLVDVQNLLNSSDSHIEMHEAKYKKFV